MIHRSTIDVEDLLRRTYREVADRTVIDRAFDADLRTVPAITDRTSHWRQWSIAAATVAVMVAGLALLAARDGAAPADESPLIHAVAGWVPQAPSPEGGSAVLPVRELVSTDTYDRIVWASDAAEVSVQVDRASTADRPSGESVTIRRSIPAVRSEAAEGGELHWSERPGVDVTVGWSGDVDDQMIADVVNGIFFVDDAAWSHVIDHGGFDAPSDSPLDERTIEAGRRVEVELVGSLHEGYSIRVGFGGYVLPVDRCTTHVDNASPTERDEGPTGFLVLGPGDVGEAVVSVPGEPAIAVPLVAVFPGVDIAIGTVELDRPPSGTLPDTTCGARR